jgi:hypothetical protein
MGNNSSTPPPPPPSCSPTSNCNNVGNTDIKYNTNLLIFSNANGYISNPPSISTWYTALYVPSGVPAPANQIIPNSNVGAFAYVSDNEYIDNIGNTYKFINNQLQISNSNDIGIYNISEASTGVINNIGGTIYSILDSQNPLSASDLQTLEQSLMNYDIISFSSGTDLLGGNLLVLVRAGEFISELVTPTIIDTTQSLCLTSCSCPLFKLTNPVTCESFSPTIILGGSASRTSETCLGVSYINDINYNLISFIILIILILILIIGSNFKF